MVIAGPSNYVPRFVNSLIIAFGSTLLSVVLGDARGLWFSRFNVPLKDDLLFFILSTRMMPPIAVAIPIYLMYRELGLSDTRLGMILLYTAVNVSLAVWLLKGFIDEIPREYEEAAMIDGYTRLQAFFKVVLPQADHRHRGDGDLLPDLRLERVRLRSAAYIRRGADRAALHPDHHWRGWPGLARRCRRQRRCSWFRSSSSPCCCGSIFCAASRLGRCANECAEILTKHRIDSRPRSGGAGCGAASSRTSRPPLIAHGVLMLLQPFSLTLYGYSFVTTLVGMAMFTIVSRNFPE